MCCVRYLFLFLTHSVFTIHVTLHHPHYPMLQTAHRYLYCNLRCQQRYLFLSLSLCVFTIHVTLHRPHAPVLQTAHRYLYCNLRCQHRMLKLCTYRKSSFSLVVSVQVPDLLEYPALVSTEDWKKNVLQLS